jgi:sugar O-acyltransferase (sialic acid O-acetyltransferase NeuD family)
MKTIVFGNGPFASMACYVLTHDAGDDVVAFTVDAAHIDHEEHEGRPVVAFERLAAHFPPDEHRLLLCVGPRDMNGLRRERYLAARRQGFQIRSYISSRALTWPDLVAGDGAIVFEGAVVQPFARIGCNTIVRSSVHVSHHVTIGDHCFIAAGACFGGQATVGERCFVGLNATIRDGVTLAEGCLIAAGAVVVNDTEPGGLYAGVPARRLPKDPRDVEW